MKKQNRAKQNLKNNIEKHHHQTCKTKQTKRSPTNKKAWNKWNNTYARIHNTCLCRSFNQMLEALGGCQGLKYFSLFPSGTTHCPGFGCDSFFQSRWHGATSWICAGNYVDNTQGCFHYYWAGLMQTQGLLCFSLHSTNEWSEGIQEVGRGHSWDSWCQLTKAVFHTIWRHA